MVSCFVVVALGSEPEVSYSVSDPLVVVLEVLTVFYVGEIASEGIAAAGYDKI